VYCEQLVPHVTQEFSIEYLDSTEIVGLIGLLERHHALGFLTDRSPQERIEAFEVRADRQLLVALHETTLGVPFERIVLNEYEGIPEEARQLYLNVCALHQFGTPVRAGLISRISGISFADFGRKFLAPLRQVVIVEGVEGVVRDVFYRSRHQRVAELVFNQVVDSDDKKFALLAKLIAGMNIEYTSDNETFGRLIRGRIVSQIFADVKVGRKLYETVKMISDRHHFIYHQLAVFEQRHPQGSLKNAEDAISEAARLNPNSKSIRHTRAEIARRLANETHDTAQKRAYRRAARRNLENGGGHPSEYDLNTRARLAVDELKEVIETAEPDSETLLKLTQEAEEAFQRARAEFPDNPDILASEANLLDVLNKAPKALAVLERAFRLNPRLDWLAIRLARRYSEAEQPAKAIEVLDTSLRKGADSKSAHFAMAKIIEETGGAQSRIIEHLRKSFVPGDMNFEAQFLYGRELFLAKSIEDAKTVFERLNEKAPGRFRTTASALAKQADGQPSDLNGMMTKKEEGYGFVRLTDFGIDVYATRAQSSSANWDQIKAGNRVSCYLAFDRRGPRAVNLRLRQV
jgi:tetratricopeptide (TPR) repeat protein